MQENNMLTAEFLNLKVADAKRIVLIKIVYDARKLKWKIQIVQIFAITKLLHVFPC